MNTNTFLILLVLKAKNIFTTNKLMYTFVASATVIVHKVRIRVITVEGLIGNNIFTSLEKCLQKIKFTNL